MIRNTLLLVAALSIASPAVVSPALAKSAEATAKTEEPANPDKEDLPLRQLDRLSIMRKRVCHTVAEWKQIEAADNAAARQTMDKFNTSRSMSGS